MVVAASKRFETRNDMLHTPIELQDNRNLQKAKLASNTIMSGQLTLREWNIKEGPCAFLRPLMTILWSSIGIRIKAVYGLSRLLYLTLV